MEHAAADLASRRSRGTADGEDVARFEAIAAEWWDPTGKFRPLHQLNPLRLAYIRDRLCERAGGCDVTAERPLAGLRILDVGCGGGLVSEGMASLGATVTGIDASATSIAVARHHAGESGLAIDYLCTVPEDLAGQGPVFDAVVAMEVVEHVADLDAFIAAIAAMTRPSGVVLLATLNRTLKSLMLAKIGAEYVLRWLPIGTHDWRRFLRPSELARALARHHLRLADARGMSYDPLAGHWSMSRDLDVNYIGCALKAG